MKLIKLTENYKNEWKSLIDEFETNQEKIIPLGMRGSSSSFLDFLIESENNSKGINLSNGIVPSDIYFLVKDKSNFLIGAIDIRHYLNDKLLKSGGNVGYGVRPSERNKGYATQILALALKNVKRCKYPKF
ncbi:MAG: GNAT family N-acetyltransferase [Cetobacterium sp.]|uniref:GNAT family N-acetyltransferase n=1 Tax=Cetobacterium sp. TaxID=2071632 RepID=UPI003EE45CAF